MIVLDTLVAIVSVAVLLSVAVLCIQVFASLLPHRVAMPLPDRRPRVAILVPAHDEEAVIAGTLRSVLPQLLPEDRLLVVADNCTDATARVAAAEGAEVLERHNLEKRGKGYALDYGVQYLAARPPVVVIVVDADCVVGAGAVSRLARLSESTGRPVQALYEMTAAPDAGLKARIAAFAWIVKNHVRPRGMLRLGLPCQLMGTGMAFPWEVLRRAPLATGHIVEDVMIGVELARGGTPPLFCPEVTVASTFPASQAGMSTQRTRWEHGHLGMMAKAPALLLQGVARADAALIALALDLWVPPLALLLVSAAGLTLAGAALPGEGARIALSSGLAVLGAFAAAILLAWQCHGRRAIALLDMARAPLYVLWKLPIYFRFLTGRESRWIRSKRESE